VQVSATAKYLRGSTRKARLVVQVIRGRSVEEAAALLRFMPQHAD
jgi:large subunit ribosomal protein L22